MAAAHDFGSHGDGSAVWTSAISVAYGDGIVPRKRTRRAPRHHWWTRNASKEDGQRS
ncbi:hypothetical protein [Microbacterium lushaniae]|uniref:hypothetical protein n=1 Tax=Microbacterium lushaniae TaxID=2614639 RepID=UPI00177C09B1|nr:hypothetical protein [Microbacterium lushaniae]